MEEKRFSAICKGEKLAYGREDSKSLLEQAKMLENMVNKDCCSKCISHCLNRNW